MRTNSRLYYLFLAKFYYKILINLAKIGLNKIRDFQVTKFALALLPVFDMIFCFGSAEA